MENYLTINSYLRKNNNNHRPSIPKLTINSCYNITTYNNKIYPNHNYSKTENKLINTEIPPKFNNYMLLNKNYLKSPNYNLFKTISYEKNSSFKRANKPNIYSRNNKSKLSRRTNKSQKVSLKLMNDFFKPEITQSYKSILTTSKIQKSKINFNFSGEAKKEMFPNNYLYYYYPNLFNVPNNRIMSPHKINPSKFLIAPLPTTSFNEEVKSLKVTQIKNQNESYNNSIGKSLYSSIITSKDNEKQNNPVFLEKLYSIDVLKNLRFGFKNSIERGKYKNFIKSFYTARNLKLILPKSK